MRKLVSLEVASWCAGLLCLSALLVIRVEAGRAAQAALHVGSAPRPQPGGAGSATQDSSSSERDLSAVNGVIGRLEISALGLRVPILNDYDPGSLRQGVGRIRGTAVPGGLGNFAVAGHRDTYFRPLRHIARGMVMHVVTDDGTFRYIVDSTAIVLPEDVGVLDIGDRPEMTLITCYPFDYIGAAPKRFIVRGHLDSVAAEAR